MTFNQHSQHGNLDFFRAYDWKPKEIKNFLSSNNSYNLFDPLDPTDSHGLVKVGAEISVDTILEAYSKGIFPWYEKPPVKWYSPPHRLVLNPYDFKVSHSFKKFIKKYSQSYYKVTFDYDFLNVINQCALVKRNYCLEESDTWITDDIKTIYSKLHELGVAHSIEVWNTKDKLVGGLYGLAIGKMFFGESMFHLETNCSKLALYELVRYLKQQNFLAIDCQVYSEHLESMGAVLIDKISFLLLLQKSHNNYQDSDVNSWRPLISEH